MNSSLFGGLSALREPRARAAKARQLLSDESPARVIAAICDELSLARRTGAASALVALDAIGVALTLDGGISYEASTALYAAAVDVDAPAVARLFFTASARATSVPTPAEVTESERPASPGGQPLPLGTRKWLARLSRADALVALTRDPHPDVVASVLENPALIERDVLAIASRRPTLPDCQRAVFASDRWRPRHPVRRALSFNPYTPVPLAARIMTTMRNSDLREIQAAPGLSSSLRMHARELAKLARPSSGSSCLQRAR
jgi:hypothetical protein